MPAAQDPGPTSSTSTAGQRPEDTTDGRHHHHRPCPTMVTAATVAVVLIVACLTGAARAGCGDRGLCCPGRNSDCVVQNHPINAIVEDLTQLDQKCYCDEFCAELDDCCDDYRYVCQAKDCVVSEWSQWTKCNKQCGIGVMRRSRFVRRQPGNGGAKCPHLVERRACVGSHCAQGTQVREIAMVLPSIYGGYRRMNESNDIRKNLFERYSYHKENKPKRNSYCVTFEVSHSHKLCKIEAYHAWTNDLSRSARVCVECQPLAMEKTKGDRCKGDGVANVETRWRATGMPGCHGRWIQRALHENCTCGVDNSDRFSNFILL